MIVQKFGGTSVADPEAIRRLIDIVRDTRAREGRGPVVVVSAMSGVTDALLAVAESAGAAATDLALARLSQLRERHQAAAAALVTGGRAADLSSLLDAHFDELDAVVRALGVLREVSGRTLDVLASSGELLNS
ncbi:MAG: lysine-sensitive aspartokinase 3, partial [Vicinamibacterales bacterium]